MSNQILDDALVADRDKDFCFVDDAGTIYAPSYDHATGKMTETGREIYDRLTCKSAN